MKPLAAGAFLSVLLSGAGVSASEPACPPQAMPAAIDSAGALPPSSQVIAFGAEPWEHPRRAWVVRLSRRGDIETRLEIVRLIGQSRCNRWDIEKRWTAPIGRDEFRSVAGAVEKFGIPPGGLVSSDEPPGAGDAIVLDGTGLELRLETAGWSVTRTLNHYGNGGAGLSAIFRDLLVKHVPPGELPTESWRTRRGRQGGR